MRGGILPAVVDIKIQNLKDDLEDIKTIRESLENRPPYADAVDALMTTERHLFLAVEILREMRRAKP